jgi:hypothetical protein
LPKNAWGREAKLYLLHVLHCSKLYDWGLVHIETIASLVEGVQGRGNSSSGQRRTNNSAPPLWSKKTMADRLCPKGFVDSIRDSWVCDVSYQ